MSDYTMLTQEMQMLGPNADGARKKKAHTSTTKLMLPTGTIFATQLTPLRTLNLDILYLLYVYNGLI